MWMLASINERLIIKEHLCLTSLWGNLVLLNGKSLPLRQQDNKLAGLTDGKLLQWRCTRSTRLLPCSSKLHCDPQSLFDGCPSSRNLTMRTHVTPPRISRLQALANVDTAHAQQWRSGHWWIFRYWLWGWIYGQVLPRRKVTRLPGSGRVL
jgi:hypothetical protein